MRRLFLAFPGGKHKVLTMSYDDGRPEDVRLISIFKENGIKGTFHLNSGLYDDPQYQRNPKEQIPELYKGMEISCHTYTHPTIARCPSTEVVKQTLEDPIQLEKYAGYPVRGMSYPNGSFSKEVEIAMEACGIEYSRTVRSTHSFAMPENYMEWDPTCHHNDPKLFDLGREFLALHKTQYLYMMYVWGHSYEFTNNDNWDRIEEFCRMMGGQEDIWYATNIEIVDYMKAWKQMKFSADGTFAFNPTAYTLWIDVDREMVPVPAGQTLHF